MRIIQNICIVRGNIANRPNAGWSIFIVLLATLAVGCGGSEDPQAYERLKAANMILMQQEGQTYQIISNRLPITEDNAADIAKLGHLKNLNFTASELNDSIFASAVSGLNPVSVVLSETAISDSGMSAMAGFSRIEAVFLVSTAISDEGLKSLGRLTSLAELNLDGTQITSDGMQHLTRLSKLKRLVLNNTSLDDTGLEQLQGMTNLSQIDAKNTKVTAAGIKAITDTIPGLLVVTE